MKFMKIKTKILIFSVLLPVFLLLLFGSLLAWMEYRSFYQKEYELNLADAMDIQSRIYVEISSSYELLRNLALNPLTPRVLKRMNTVPEGVDNDDFINLDEASELSILMESVIQGTNVDLVYAATMDSRGILLGRDVQLDSSFDVRKRDYYQGALANPGTPFISQPRVSAEKTDEPKIVVTAARAVLHEQQKQGIVALNYSFNPIIKIIREQMEQFNAQVFLYDTKNSYLLWGPQENGDYFYNPEQTLTLSDLGLQMGIGEQDMDSFSASLVDDETYFFQGEVLGVESLVQAVHIPDTRWAIMVSSSLDQIKSDVISSILPPILIFIAVFLVAQMIVYLLYLKILIKPLSFIGMNLENLATSDANLTVSIPVSREDEIGNVAQSFNLFVRNLQELMVDVKKAISGTDDIKQSIIASTEETSSSIDQISANLHSISGQIDVLDSSITDTVSAIEEVTQNISSMDEQIISQSAMVEQSTAAITEMIASIKTVNAVAQNKKQTTQALSLVANEGKERISHTAETFKAVVDQIGSIQVMASTINSIAAQTNLLSMNAAIEAAHAGDSGRGFAVVAEEIRKLADSAAKSSRSITQSIKDITTSVNETEINVKDSTLAFDKISDEVGDTVNAFAEIEQSVSELNTGGQQILESTHQINEVTLSIRTGSNEIKPATESMLESSGKIKEVSERVSTGMTESTTGAQEIVQSMKMMIDLTHQLNNIVQELKKDFGQFRTE